MTQTKTKPPFVKVLSAIRPVDNNGILEYPNLSSSVNLHKGFDSDRQEIFYSEEPGTLDEERAAKELAKSYFLQTVMRLSLSTGPVSEEIWANRMTNAAIEIYGEPDSEKARKLLSINYLEIKNSTVPNHLESEKQELLDFFEGYGATCAKTTSEDTNERSFDTALETVKEQLGQYINKNYGAALALFESLPKENELQPQMIVDIFNKAISSLLDTHPELKGWKAVIKEKSDTIYTNDDTNTIEVGENRTSSLPDELAGTFLHEIIAHATRSVIGRKISPQLGKGLPGHLSFEEGLGGVVEFVTKGSIPDKIADRYTDIAIALGLNGRKVTRSELRKFAALRSKIRMASSPSEENSESDQWKALDTHINRIYRGSKGDNIVGVFTKDITYFEGFEKVIIYIDNLLRRGYSIDEIIDNLLEGRIDPTNDAHVSYKNERMV